MVVAVTGDAVRRCDDSVALRLRPRISEPTRRTRGCRALCRGLSHVWYSQSARGYTMLLFATLLCTWLLLRGMRQGGWAWWLAYAVAGALGVYTHLTMVFVVLGHAAACCLAVVFGGAEGAALDTIGRCGFCPLWTAHDRDLFSMLGELQAFFAKKPPKAGVVVATPRSAAVGLLRESRGSGPAALAVAPFDRASRRRRLGLRTNPLAMALFVLPAVVTAALSLGMKRPVYPRFLFSFAGYGLLVVVRGVFVVAEGRAGRVSAAAQQGPAWGTGLIALLLVASVAALPQRLCSSQTRLSSRTAVHRTAATR